MINISYLLISFLPILFSGYFLQEYLKNFKLNWNNNFKEVFIFNIFKLCDVEEEEDTNLYEIGFMEIIVLFFNFLLSSLFFILPNKEIDLMWLLITTLSLNFSINIYYYFSYGFKCLNNRLEWKSWNIMSFLFPYIEIFSSFFKILNAGFRIYSNYIAGHLVLILLFYLNNFINITALKLISIPFFLITVIIYYLIALLEILLAAIQYYVFLLLNIIFCSDSH